jgi:hypothetical protein
MRTLAGVLTGRIGHYTGRGELGAKGGKTSRIDPPEAFGREAGRKDAQQAG